MPDYAELRITYSKSTLNEADVTADPLAQFERWFANRAVGLVVMEACGSAHHWARWLNGLGVEVRLLPAQYVRAYVRRNKTDATDAAALLEACRCADLRPVRVKSVELLMLRMEVVSPILQYC